MLRRRCRILPAGEIATRNQSGKTFGHIGSEGRGGEEEQ